MNINKLIFLLFILEVVYSTPLQDVFNSAEPFQNYDKYLVLNNDEIYTGSLGIYEGRIFIKGNGAVLDLMYGGGIWVYATNDYPAHLEVEYLNIINGGYYGISYAGTSTGKIENCNFIDNDFGLKFFDRSSVEVKNSNFVGCGTYALGLFSMEPNIQVSYCNFWENAYGDLQENCPGWGNIWTPWEPEVSPGLIYGNPSFTDSGNLDFSLLPNSLCIDSGNPEQFDTDETRRDIGAGITIEVDIFLGDCNNDSQQNILDVLYIINNCILSVTELDCDCSDVNIDGAVNILDIVGLVQIILED